MSQIGPSYNTPKGLAGATKKAHGISWKSIPQEEKNNIVVQAVKDVQKMLEQYGRIINQLANHTHDEKTQEPVIVKRVGTHTYPETSEKVYSIFDDIDFDN